MGQAMIIETGMKRAKGFQRVCWMGRGNPKALVARRCEGHGFSDRDVRPARYRTRKKYRKTFSSLQIVIISGMVLKLSCLVCIR